MAFHRKYSAALQLDADILVVPECANASALLAKGFSYDAGPMLWVGSNRHKGLAVFGRGPYRLVPIHEPNEDLPSWLLPARIITPGGAGVDLLAVWPFWYRDKRSKGDNAIVGTLERFSDRFNSDSMIVAGDFNNSIIWDSGKSTDHSATSMVLKSLGLVSAYHTHRGVAYGNEPEPTIYWRNRTLDGPRYHIDYVYVSERFIGTGVSVTVGSHREWVASHLSDHVPLVVDIPSIT